MKRKSVLLILVAFLVFSCSTAFAVPEHWKLVIRQKGTVENQSQGRGQWHMIWQSRMLRDGDLARTGSDSRANIRLADQSVITLGENTQVEVAQFQVQKQSRAAEIKLFFGRVRSRVGRFGGRDSKFEVKTPNAVLAARGTDFLVEYMASPAQSGEGGSTKLMVFESSVDVTSNGTTTTVSEGNSAIIGADGSIVMNPPDFQPTSSGSGTGTDGDMLEYEPDVAEGETGSPPPDPSTPTDGTATASGDSSTGGVAPPPGTTGNITIIIKPPMPVQ